MKVTTDLRIGITGVHRVGKSTVAKRLAELYKIPFVQIETARHFATYGADPAKPMDYMTRLYVQTDIMAEAAQVWGGQEGPFISDRTPLDFLVYLLSEITPIVGTEFDESIEDYIQKSIKLGRELFDIIILIQPGIPVVHEPGKGLGNLHYMEHLHRMFLGYKKTFNLVVMPERLLDLENRVKWVSKEVYNREICNILEKF